MKKQRMGRPPASNTYLSAWMIYKGLRNADFAKKVGAGSMTVARWRRGGRISPVYVRLVKVLFPECPVQWSGIQIIHERGVRWGPDGPIPESQIA